ncbi:MAG: bifunctional alpha/beta hydrolase/OsmC family protein [Candidatus Nucleicultricaceae bacterium]|jgi:putative redox protein
MGVLTTTERITFINSSGQTLSARLDLPEGNCRFYALYVHCFTCSKDLLPASRICRFLAAEGIGVLRFDMTGLGASEGDFSETNFETNLSDILSAVETMVRVSKAPSLLIGHSLGGTAAIVASQRIPSLKAVVSINAPSHPRHVKKRFLEQEDKIMREGSAEVLVEGRPFVIKKHFLAALEETDMQAILQSLRVPLLVMQAPDDSIVNQQNGFDLFAAAKNPKSFCALPRADHLLTEVKSSEYVASMINAWVAPYIAETHETLPLSPIEGVVVAENKKGKFTQDVTWGEHVFRADEPVEVPGGLGTGPSPYDFLMAGLGACTSMTLRMYADLKKIQVEHISVHVQHHKEDLSEEKETLTTLSPKKPDQIDVFSREISIEGPVTAEQRASLLAIAEKCPVHKTLSRHSEIMTKLTDIKN